MAVAFDLTRLLLLGLLELGGPTHGYAVRKELESMNAQAWADVRPGSIYSGLAQLAKEGLVRELSDATVTDRRRRPAVEITDTGRSALRGLLERAWREPRLSADPFDVALALSPLLPLQVREGLLAERREQLKTMQAQLRERKRRAVGNAPHLQAIVDDLFDHHTRRLRTETKWGDEVADHVTRGLHDLPSTRPTFRQPRTSR
jgi:DNA-binding PadR family transcriptional regulator